MPKYNVTKDINSETRPNNFMGTGIHENCELKNIEEGKAPIVLNESKTGKKFATIHFVNEKGEVLVHTEFEPVADTQEVLENKTLNQIKRFKHIITKFVSDDAFLFEATDFEDFVKKCIEILGDSYKGKKVRIKVVLTDKGYTTLPKYVPFIETMDIDLSKSKLSINSLMDKMVRDKADVEQRSNINPFETSTEGYVADETINQATIYSDNSMNSGSDDLPF